MSDIKFQIVKPNDTETIHLIADWYLSEWKIPIEKTIQRLQKITTEVLQFQVLMTLDNKPISTGGLYDYVGLLDKEPRLKIYKNWLALVYTIPGKRHQGFGALICNYIQDHSKSLGINKLYLFTDTAERLYKRLGWTEIEKLSIDSRNIVVMKKDSRIPNSVSTNRLSLAIIAYEDSDFIYSLVNSKGWIEFIGDRKVQSKNDAITYINKILHTEDLFYWVVRTKESNVPIGIISFLKRAYLDNFDIGFAFLPEFNGHGYAYEATSEILSIVSKKTEFNPVLATTVPSNDKSIQLLTKLGFNFKNEVVVGNEKLSIYSTKTPTINEVEIV